MPGHGPAGGLALIAAQRRYHDEVGRLVRGRASDQAARAAVLAAFPGFHLPEGVESAVQRFRSVR